MEGSHAPHFPRRAEPKAERLLDAILKPRLAGNPQLLAAWQSAKRVRPTTAAALTSEATTPELKVAWPPLQVWGGPASMLMPDGADEPS